MGKWSVFGFSAQQSQTEMFILKPGRQHSLEYISAVLQFLPAQGTFN